MKTEQPFDYSAQQDRFLLLFREALQNQPTPPASDYVSAAPAYQLWLTNRFHPYDGPVEIDPSEVPYMDAVWLDSGPNRRYHAAVSRHRARPRGIRRLLAWLKRIA